MNLIPNVRALVVGEQRESLNALQRRLEKLAIEVLTAGSYAETAPALWSDSPPHIVFTESRLADGDWADVLALAEKASLPVNVIVLAPFVDVGFYLQTIERGAFDFVVPPLSDSELLHVVRVAAENALSRRLRHPATGLARARSVAALRTGA